MYKYEQKFLNGSTRDLWVDVHMDGSFDVWGNPGQRGPKLSSGDRKLTPSQKYLIACVRDWLRDENIQ